MPYFQDFSAFVAPAAIFMNIITRVMNLHHFYFASIMPLTEIELRMFPFSFRLGKTMVEP